jgi:hypothetical protein
MKLLAVLGALLSVFGIALANMDALGDTFWSIALGRMLLSDGVPSHEPFAFTAASAPFVVTMPLSSLLFAVVEGRFGLQALLVVGAVIVTAALGLVWLGASSERTRWVLFPLLPLVVFTERDDLCVRGQLLADVAFATFLVALPRGSVASNTATRRSRLAEWFVPVLLGAFWMNAHPSAVLGASLLYAEAAITVLCTRRGRETVSALRTATLFTVGLCLTPRGPDLAFQAFDLARLASTRRLDLFRSPDFHRPEVVFWSILAPTALAFALRRGRTIGALRLLVFLALAASGRRHLPWLAMTTIVELGAADWSDAIERPFVRRAAMAVSAGAALICVLSLRSGTPDPLANMPAAGMRYIDARRKGRVFNAYHWGGYLDYAWGPSNRVFIDGRNYLFDRNGVFDDHERVATLDPSAAEILDAYEIRTILWENGSPLDSALSSDRRWILRFRGPIEVVYERADRDAVPSR